jgi:putative phosphoesterase
VRIGVISDTHIPDKVGRVPEAILDAFKNVDLIMHAGDMVDLEVIEELRSVCPTIVAVAGNMDRAEVAKKYPTKQVFNISGIKIGLAHGSGAPAGLIELLKNIFKADKCDIIVFGHSHDPVNKKIGKTLFFNPGSATDSFSGEISYGIIEINGEVKANIIRI